MSEHFFIDGRLGAWHLPYGDEYSLAWCHRCKETPDRVRIKLDEGGRISLICLKCKKTIWTTSSLKTEDNADELFVKVNDDKKCFICGKPTNEYDCCSQTMAVKIKDGKAGKSEWAILCSKKCENKYFKQQERRNEKCDKIKRVKSTH